MDNVSPWSAEQSAGPWAVGVLNTNHTVSLVDGGALYATEAEAREVAQQRSKEKPFLAFVPWPVPHMRGLRKYSVLAVISKATGGAS